MNDAIDKIRGLSHFTDFFASEKNQFVIIGGIATAFCLDGSDIKARVTKDIDLVILANPNTSFADRLKSYIKDGGYQIESSKDGKARKYRFIEPKDELFPLQIEIFSAVEFEFDLLPGQRIIPIESSQGFGSLSAILLDEDYFGLVKANVQVLEGVPVLNIPSLIALKARAFLDLTERREKGDKVSSRDIKKHRSDVFRLLAVMTEDSFPVKDSIAEDLRRFLKHKDIQNINIRSLLNQRVSLEELSDIAVQCFQL